MLLTEKAQIPPIREVSNIRDFNQSKYYEHIWYLKGVGIKKSEKNTCG